MDTAELIGLTKEDALDVLDARNLKYRILREDSKGYLYTADFKPERINLEIENGHVVAATKG